MKARHLFFLLFPLVASCYKSPSTSENHYYASNYNFIVDADSLILLSGQPEEKMSGLPADTFVVYKDEQLVVSDIRVLPADTIDSVWVEVATARANESNQACLDCRVQPRHGVANGQAVFGWSHENELLDGVVPDDPISQFISVFSDIHLITFLTLLVIMVAAYTARMVKRGAAPMVHLRDINSFYPTLLCIIVALAAVLYASIQMFAPEEWQQFYFHPTLNPFSTSTILSVFLCCVWAIVIITIASIDDVGKTLLAGDAVLYLGGVAAVCATNYLVFSFATLHCVGYPLLIAYIVFALVRYFRYSFAPFVCGNCASRLRRKGRCPRCGAMNE